MKTNFTVFFFILITAVAIPLRAQGSGADTDFLYAKKLYDDKMYSLSAQEFTRFIRNYPNDLRIPDARYFAGLSFYNLNQFDAARREFQFLAIDFPKDKRSIEAWMKISECYAALNDYAAAANALASLVSFYPQSPNVINVHLLISDYHIKAGEIKNAKDKLNKFIVDYPDIPELFQARFRLAVILASEQQTDLAIYEYQQIIDRAKDTELKSSALYEKAKLLEFQGKSDQAKSAYTAIVTRFPKTKIYPAALYETGMFAYREKKYADAMAIFESLIKTELGSRTIKNMARLRIGDMHFQSGQFDKAVSAYKKNLESGTDSATVVETRFKLALAYEYGKQYRSSVEHMAFITDSLMDFKKDTLLIALAHIRMAQNLSEMKKNQEALNYYKYFTENFPRFPRIDGVILKKISVLLEGLQDYNEATHQLELFISQYPLSRQIDYAYLLLGRVYVQNGRIERAHDLLESFRYKFPGSRYHEDVRRELWNIRHYHTVSSESTVENMISLLGQLIEGKPKDELELSYGKLFFYQLKNYKDAVSIFRKILTRTREKETADEVTYYIALSFDLLARKQQSSLSDSAFAYYKKLNASRYADIAQMRIIEMNLQTIAGADEHDFKAKMHYTNWLERFPESPSRDQALFCLGTALFRLNEIKTAETIDTVSGGKISAKKEAKDTIAFRLPVYSAMSCFDEIIRQHPKSEWVDDAYFYKSLCYDRTRQSAESMKQLQNYLHLYPRGEHAAQAKFHLARLKEQSGDPQSAIAVFEDLLNNYYYSAYADSAAQGIGHAYVSAKKFKKAVIAYENSRKYNADEFSAVDILRETAAIHAIADYQLGFSHHQLGNQSKAIEFYEKYLFPDYQGPLAHQALWALADIYFSRKEFVNAVRYYSLISERFPETEIAFQSLNRIAEIHFTNEQYAEAKKAYAKLSELSKSVNTQMIYDAKEIVCTYRLGLVAQTSNLEKQFVKKYEKEKGSKILLQNFNAEFLFELGRYYQYTLKNYDLASKTYLRLTDQYRAADIVSEALFQLGVIRFGQGKSKEGFDIFQQIIQRYPDSDIIPGVYLRMAVEAFKLEQVQTSIESAKYALQHPKLKPSDARVGTDFLIKVYKTVGYYENALVLIQRYIEQFPDDDPVNLMSKRIDIGIMHRNLKSYDRAIEHLKDLMKISTGEDEAEIQYHIAQTYYERGQFQQALIEFLRIPYLQLGSKFDWATAAKSQAAECYVKLEQYPEAARIYEDIIKTHGQASEYGLFARQRLTEIRKFIK